jgi:AcrR family transcriptional regulator
MLPNEDEKLDPRVRRTRQMLIEAFTDLLKEKGFAALNVNDITARAGVNRATFYAHFPDKYALLDHQMREAFRKTLDGRVLNACHFSLDNLRVLIVTVCEFVGEIHSHNGAEEQFQSLAEAQIREQVSGLVTHWLEQMNTLERCTISRERAAIAASWAIYGLAHQWAHEKQKTSAEQFAGEVLPLVAANLGQTIELG